MAKFECNVPKELTRMDQEKRNKYSQKPSNPNTLFHAGARMVAPIVVLSVFSILLSVGSQT